MLLIASLIIWTSMLTNILVAGVHNDTTTHAGYLSMEGKIISDLETYIDNQESILQMLRKKLLTFKVEHSEALQNGDKYFSNELNKFLFIKRLSSDINLMALNTFEAANKFKSLISHYGSEKMLPTEKDLRQSSLKIAQMQNVYKLRTDKTVKGGFFGSCEQKRLSTEDCYQIGKQLNSAKMYREAIEWLKKALKHYNEYYDLHQVNDIQILEELAISLAFSNQEHQANDVIEKILRMDSNNQILSHIKHKDNNRSRRSITISDLCRPMEQLLSFLTFTCLT
ncbi:hypothetical protein PVAND_003937 [Polypedilum vanderplanki]|uniref:Prolyl 4-hydroxylase alpha-subunit N-terminal domain-containing protein n=1 Tax=Polypedilum vanderplanki TaxID=319348 RepID=A0A9J6BVJ0_POLVA|nr:hypothetical protein PVAND_003937 [Polypedilum vanderplanki]